MIDLVNTVPPQLELPEINDTEEERAAILKRIKTEKCFRDFRRWVAKHTFFPASDDDLMARYTFFEKRLPTEYRDHSEQLSRQRHQFEAAVGLSPPEAPAALLARLRDAALTEEYLNLRSKREFLRWLVTLSGSTFAMPPVHLQFVEIDRDGRLRLVSEFVDFEGIEVARLRMCDKRCGRIFWAKTLGEKVQTGCCRRCTDRIRGRMYRNTETYRGKRKERARRREEKKKWARPLEGMLRMLKVLKRDPTPFVARWHAGGDSEKAAILREVEALWLEHKKNACTY